MLTSKQMATRAAERVRPIAEASGFVLSRLERGGGFYIVEFSAGAIRMNISGEMNLVGKGRLWNSWCDFKPWPGKWGSAGLCEILDLALPREGGWKVESDLTELLWRLEQHLPVIAKYLREHAPNRETDVANADLHGDEQNGDAMQTIVARNRPGLAPEEMIQAALRLLRPVMEEHQFELMQTAPSAESYSITFSQQKLGVVFEGRRELDGEHFAWFHECHFTRQDGHGNSRLRLKQALQKVLPQEFWDIYAELEEIAWLLESYLCLLVQQLEGEWTNEGAELEGT